MKVDKAPACKVFLYRNMGCDVYKHPASEDLCIYRLERENMMPSLQDFLARSIDTLGKLPPELFIHMEPVVCHNKYAYITVEHHGEPLTEYINRVKQEGRVLSGEEFWKIVGQIIYIVIAFHGIQSKFENSILLKDYSKLDPTAFIILLKSFAETSEASKVGHGALSPSVFFIDKDMTIKMSVINFFSYIKIISDSLCDEATFDLASFAAPEAVLGGQITRKIDAWSLGAILWYLIKFDTSEISCTNTPDDSSKLPVIPRIERDIQICLTMLLVREEDARWNVEDLLYLPRISEVMRALNFIPEITTLRKSGEDYFEPTIKYSTLQSEQMNVNTAEREENEKKVAELMAKVSNLEKQNSDLLLEIEKHNAKMVSAAVSLKGSLSNKEPPLETSPSKTLVSTTDVGIDADPNYSSSCSHRNTISESQFQDLVRQNAQIMAELGALTEACQNMKQQMQDHMASDLAIIKDQGTQMFDRLTQLATSSSEQRKHRRHQHQHQQDKLDTCTNKPSSVEGTNTMQDKLNAQAPEVVLSPMQPLSEELQILFDRLCEDSTKVQVTETLHDLVAQFVDKRDFWYHYHYENDPDPFKDMVAIKVFTKIRELQDRKGRQDRSSSHHRTSTSSDAEELDLLLRGKNRYGQYVLSTLRSLLIRMLTSVQGRGLLARGYSEEYVTTLLGNTPQNISRDTLEAEQPDGQTILSRLIEQGNMAYVQLVRQTTKNKRYVSRRFNIAFRMGHYVVVEATAMMISAYLGWAALVKELMPYEKREMALSHTALMAAIFGLQKECTVLLAPEESGSRSTSGKTALTHAAQHGFVEGVQALLQYEIMSGDNLWENSTCSLARSPVNKGMILMMLECCMSVSNECSSEGPELHY